MLFSRKETTGTTNTINVRFDSAGTPRLDFGSAGTPIRKESHEQLLRLIMADYESLSRAGSREYTIPAWIAEFAGTWTCESFIRGEKDRCPELRLIRQVSGDAAAKGPRTTSLLPAWVPEYLRWAERVAAAQPDESGPVLAGQIRALTRLATDRPDEFLRQLLIGHLQHANVEHKAGSQALQNALHVAAIECVRALDAGQLLNHTNPKHTF